jgi:hypothetical protein
MKNLFTLAILVMAMYGCTNGGDESPSQSNPISSQVTLEQRCASASVVLPKTNTITVTGSTSLTIEQPAFLWFPRWTVSGGTLVPGSDIFHATIIPNAETCIVVIEWYQIDTPPPPPSCLG